MAVALAGRMAQTKQFPDWGDDSGASSDLKKATAWANYAISQLGLDQEIGNIVLSDELPSLENGGLLFECVQVWLKEAEEQCAATLEQHWDQLDGLAKRLIKDEVVTGEELRSEFAISLTGKPECKNI